MLLSNVFPVATLVSLASALYIWVPDYRCVDDGTCPSAKREIGSTKESLSANTVRIVQRLPINDLPHEVRISRLADRLVRKYERAPLSDDLDGQANMERRANTYTVMTAPTPTQPNSAGIYQDGTDYSYFAPVSFGSKGTKMYMLLDTGADRSWVMSSTCISSACQNHNLFDASTSTTSKTSTTQFSISYGSGSVSGVLATDTITFAGLTLPMTFGLANNTSDDFLNFPIDGILGLSLSKSGDPTFIDRVVASKALKSNIFGVSLNRMSDGSNTGEINFGAPDTTRFSGALGYTNVDIANSGGNWAIPMDNVGFGKTQSGLTGRLAFLDTGTSFIFCPPKDAATFHALIKGATSEDNITYHVPCTTKDSISFTFSGITYNVLSKDWIGPMANGICTSNVYGRSVVGANWLIGDTFLKNVYAVFDADKSRVGLAAVTASTSTTSSTPASTKTSASGAPSGSAAAGSTTIATVTTMSASNVGTSTTSTTAMPGLNGHQTTAAGDTVAAETSAASPTPSQTIKSGANRLDLNLVIKVLTAIVLLSNLT